MGWDQTMNAVVEMPQTFTNLATVNNTYVPPMGYSFVLMNVPQTVTVSSASESGSMSQSRSVERSHSVQADEFLSRPPISVSRQATPEPPADQKRKYKHRSKQERIEQVHAEVKEKYTALGLYAGEDEVLRGFDTVRVHVKTYRGLNVIDQPLDMIMNSPDVQVLKIATPFSMKNKFQKKGFIVYLKLASPEQVEIVQSIFREFADYFPKCDIALKKEDKLRLDEEKKQAEEAKNAALFESPTFKSQEGIKDLDDFHWDDAWACGPPPMKKQGSVSSIAA